MLWNVSTCSGSVICCGNHMPPGLEYCSRKPSAGSGAGAGAAATGSGLGVVAGVVCPVLGLLVPPPHAATMRPHRIAVCFMADLIPRITELTNNLHAVSCHQRRGADASRPASRAVAVVSRSEEHTSELQSLRHL